MSSSFNAGPYKSANPAEGAEKCAVPFRVCNYIQYGLSAFTTGSLDSKLPVFFLYRFNFAILH